MLRTQFDTVICPFKITVRFLNIEQFQSFGLQTTVRKSSLTKLEVKKQFVGNDPVGIALGCWNSIRFSRHTQGSVVCFHS